MSLNASLSSISTEFRIFSKLTTAGVTPPIAVNGLQIFTGSPRSRLGQILTPPLIPRRVRALIPLAPTVIHLRRVRPPPQISRESC